MPQEFHALRCVECGTFQVHIVKKVAKWACKICQKKQSVLQEFARGSGKDCRLHVQRLNKLRVERDSFVPEDPTDCREHDVDYESPVGSEVLGSKWEKYLDEKEESSEEYQELEAGADEARVTRKRRRNQQSAPSTKKLARRGDEADDIEDDVAPCVDVGRPKEGLNGNNIERGKAGLYRYNIERPTKAGLEGELCSKQAHGGHVASKWAKYVDPTDEDDINTEEQLEADEEEDLDELLTL